MIAIRESQIEELSTFVIMESSEDTLEFIIPYTLEEHQAKFNAPDIVYLSIANNERLAGFIILALDPDGISVEFRRIVVSAKGNGIGQAAIKAMEAYCRTTLQRNRIWLDVFEFNKRGQHIYEKLGYTQFKRRDHKGQPLLFYEKRLFTPAER